MNTRTKVLLALLLFLLPFAVRWVWFERLPEKYTPPEIPDLEGLTVTLPETTFKPVTDRPQPGNGRVIADLTHNNNLLNDDLTPLRERLAARGIELELLTNFSALESTLRGATAFVIAAPTYSFDSYERDIIIDFVQDGGKLLLIADPTRQVPIPEEDLFYNPYAIFFPDSAVPPINSLSSVFGLIYFDDYLYHLESEEGNYRNVRYTDLDERSPLLEGVNDLVLFAAHSLRGGQPLISGADHVLSNKRAGETSLIPAVMAADGQVVALGDLTLITAPYHTVADNDRFLSNLADWLAEASRVWDLADFPYLFDDTVEFVQLKQGEVDPRLFVFGSNLQSSFEGNGLQLAVSNIVSPTQDTLLVGTFLEHEPVTSLLHTAGVTITLTFSETKAGESPTLDDLQTGTLEINGLGTLDIRGTTLYVESPVNGDDVAVLVLAYDDTALQTALSNLLSGLPSGCLKHYPLTICSTGVVNDPKPPKGQDGSSSGSGSTPTPGEGALPPAGAPNLLIIALDNGPDGVLTSAFDLAFYLGATYNVTVWSLSEQGNPTSSDVAGYDLYIIDSGDYAFDFGSYVSLDALSDITAPSWILGAQPIFAFETEPLVDVAIADFTHPIVAGLNDMLITLSASFSGVPEELFRPEDFEGSGGSATIILTRGPGNATPGGPVLFAVDDGTAPRNVILAMPFYRLPFDIQETLALNIVAWMLDR